MKALYKISLALMLLALWLAPVHPALAKGLADDKVVFGGSYVLKSGQTLNGTLVIFGGTAVIQKGATVDGDLAQVGGNLDLNGTVTGNVALVGGELSVGGTVEGDMVLLGGSATLTPTAVVEGNVNTAGGQLDKAEGAVIKGQVENSANFSIGPLAPLAPISPLAPIAPLFRDTGSSFAGGFGLLGAVFTVLSESFLLALLAALVALFMPNHTRRVANAIVEQPLTAGGVGCLTLIIALVALILLAALSITIILIPVTVSLIGLGSLALAAALLLGTIALGLETGNRLARAFHTEWPLPLSAFLGTLLLSLAVSAIATVLACFGWWAPFAVILAGVGGVVMTRFGAQAPLPPVAPVSGPLIAAPPPGPAPVTAAPAVPPPPAAPPEPPTLVEEPPKPKAKKGSGSTG